MVSLEDWRLLRELGSPWRPKNEHIEIFDQIFSIFIATVLFFV